MAELNDLSVTDASNTARFPEGMSRASVNNAARALEGILARADKDNNGSLTTGGTSTAYTVTLNSQHSAWFTGLRFRAKLNATCGATPTINPTGSAALGAKSLYLPDGTQVTTGYLVSGGMYDFVYDGTNVQVTGVQTPVAAASETVAGKAELATQTETNTGTDDARIVTPLKLTTWTPAVGTVTVARNDKVLLADTSASGILKQGLVSDFVTLVQRVYTSDAAVATGTTVMPDDDSIPQNTEGDQYMSLAITPTSASNRLRIYVKAYLSQSAGTHMTYALFQDSTANALAAGMVWNPSNGRIPAPAILMYEMAAGTTSATTFKFRAGGNAAATTTFNGESGARLLGGVCNSVMIIEEIIP